MPFSMLTKYAATFPISGFENLSEDAGFLKRLLYGLKLCGIGMGVVFLILASLWLIIYCSKFLNRNNAKAESDSVKKPSPLPVPGEDAAAAPADDEQTLAAVVSSAIAAFENKKDASYQIISINKL